MWRIFHHIYITPLCLNSMEQILEELGFSDKEAKTYLKLLKTPNVSATELSKYLPFDRRTVYDVIFQLYQSGYVSQYKENNVTKYFATNPKVILKEFEEKKKRIEKLIPLINTIQPKSEQTVEILKGKRGFISVLEEIKEKKCSHYAFGSIETATKNLNTLIREYLKEYEKLDLPEKVIFEEGYKFTPLKKGKYRHLPKSMVPPTAVVIYDDVTILFLNDSEDTLIRMRSKEVTQAYIAYFKGYWCMAKPY